MALLQAAQKETAPIGLGGIVILGEADRSGFGGSCPLPVLPPWLTARTRSNLLVFLKKVNGDTDYCLLFSVLLK